MSSENDPFSNLAHPPQAVRVKGRLPAQGHHASFGEIYSSTTVPANVELALAAPVRDLIQFWGRVAPQAHWTPEIPPFTGLLQAVDGSIQHQAGLNGYRLVIADSPASKRSHTLGWIDSNVKLRIEDHVRASGIQAPAAASQLSSLVFRILAILFKAADHRIGSSMTFNESVYLQECCVDLCLGPHAKAFGFLHAARGSALNAAALEVVRARAGNDVEALLREAIVSGFAIVDVPRESDVLLDEESKEHLGQVYGSALSQVLDRRGPARALDLGGFLTSLASATSLVWVLDDNGETIFDLRFLDQLLLERPLELTLLTNSTALSENSTTAQVLELLPRFPELWRASRQGALRVISEDQRFTALEPARCRPGTMTALRSADLVLFKGINLYEVFRDTGINAFYAFTVAGPNAMRLTSAELGEPIMIHIPRDGGGHAE